MQDPQRIPVIVGVGESIDRDNTKEPRTLLREAAFAAAAESHGLLSRVDSIDVVSIISCRYLDIGRVLANDLGIDPKRAEESVDGGEKPIRLLGEAAERIMAGTSQAALICGAEATRTRARAAQVQEQLAWGPIDPAAKPITALDFVTPHAVRYGLVLPPQVYPLYENATRHAWQQTTEEADRESADLWSRYSDAAVRNPTAWIRKPHSADAIRADTADNRMIAYPYRKLMVANPMVNQGAAILVTSLLAAQQAGIPAHHLVYLGGGARATEPADFLKRDRFDHSTAQDAVLHSTVSAYGASATAIDLFEFYSCFPTVPKMARRSLQLSAAINPSVTGGLTFFGGPANNFMTHALAAAVRALRSGEGRSALLYGQGEFVTKHAAMILTSRAPHTAFTFVDVQEAANAAAGPIPELLEDYAGPAHIETFTIVYDRSGQAQHAPVIARTPSGARVVARVCGDETALITFLLGSNGDPIGAPGIISRDDDKLLRFSLHEPRNPS